MSIKHTHITPVSARMIALDAVADALPRRRERRLPTRLQRAVAFIASILTRAG